MMAVRERAVKVMAALDRRVPSLDDFVGQSWTAWAEWAGVTAADGSDVEDCSKNGKKAAEAMSLSKEDMSIFGLYPGHDDFYLVVCSHCGQVVKPQAFEKHCERRHSPLAKLYTRLRSPAPVPQTQQRPHHGHSPSHGTNAASASSWEGRGQAAGPPPWAAPPSPSTPPQYRHSKSFKDGVRHSPLEKSSHSSHTESSSVFKQPTPLEPPLSSPPPSLRDPPWPHGSTPPGRPSPSDRPPAQRKESPLASAVAGHRIPRPYNKVASRRECDLDKHCGVLDPERKKVCTRLLTCNIHSIHQRRKVAGRSKNFDQLVAELKTRVREKGAQSLEGGSSAGRSPSPEAPKEQTGAPHCRRPLATLPAFSRSTALPLAACSFGSHALGHGIYTFDRRLHHLRSALSSMMEQHISAHLWKKIPQAADLQFPAASAKTAASSSSSSPSSIAASPLHSKIRTGSHISSSLKTASSSSSSSSSRRVPGRPLTTPQSENSASGGGGVGVGHLTSPVKPTVVRQAGPGRTRNPVGRPTSVPSPLPHGQTNGTLSPAGKPRPQPSPSESLSPAAKVVWTYRRTHAPLSRSSPPDSSSAATNNSHSRGAGTDSGLHGQGSGRSFEHQGLVKKRKGGSVEEHSPSSKPSAHRLASSSSSSSSPRSNFYPWKESKGGGGLTGGMEKKLGTQKPKVRH
ncbi:hypothetical protein LDENG_00099870 [Lucifuga dentata]|nr:hypothetical protein LDENG_00099870 [Lucifuga dentata]